MHVGGGQGMHRERAVDVEGKWNGGGCVCGGCERNENGKTKNGGRNLERENQFDFYYKRKGLSRQVGTSTAIFPKFLNIFSTGREGVPGAGQHFMIAGKSLSERVLIQSWVEEPGAAESALGWRAGRRQSRIRAISQQISDGSGLFRPSVSWPPAAAASQRHRTFAFFLR